MTNSIFDPYFEYKTYVTTSYFHGFVVAVVVLVACWLSLRAVRLRAWGWFIAFAMAILATVAIIVSRRLDSFGGYMVADLMTLFGLTFLVGSAFLAIKRRRAKRLGGQK